MWRRAFGAFGKQERERMPEQDECPVCFDTLRTGPSGLFVNNSMVCPSGHHVCTKCVRKLARPRLDVCCGFEYRCPICRDDVALSPFHTLLLLKGTWTGAHNMFEHEDDAIAWLGPCEKRAKRATGRADRIC